MGENGMSEFGEKYDEAIQLVSSLQLVANQPLVPKSKTFWNMYWKIMKKPTREIADFLNPHSEDCPLRETD